MFQRRLIKYLLISIVLILAGCSLLNQRSSGTATIPASTNTPEIPTPTEPPLAIRVNGEGVWLAEYQSSLQQFQQAQTSLGTQYTDADARQMVIDDLVAQVLLEQGALAAGFQPDPASTQSRMDALVSQMGGQDAFQTWLQTNFYTTDTFKQSLARAIAADWQKQKIMDQVPTKTEQVHARQILVYTSQKADQIYSNLQAGADFKTLAFQYDPLTGGDLGWFPRGYLTQKSIEDAAFSLQPGQYSSVIQTDFGYQMIQVIERDPAYPLSADALQVLQKAAVRDWIAQQKANSKIEILVP
jgi:peptidyl-prolyl cis-trans isomerase C